MNLLQLHMDQLLLTGQRGEPRDAQGMQPEDRCGRRNGARINAAFVCFFPTENRLAGSAVPNRRLIDRKFWTN
jgi:hypothetical protein